MTTFILTGKTSDFITSHGPVMLDRNKNYEAALLRLETSNSFPNITPGKNNALKYSADNGKTWKIIALDIGSYELEAINNEIKRQLVANGDSDSAISLTANISRLTSIINIDSADYKIDFNVENSIGPLLGFDAGGPTGGAKLIGYGYNESPNIVDIMPVNSILVNIDIISASHVNGKMAPVVYSFYPNVPPGFKIVEIPNPELKYYPLSSHDISRIRVWLTDQDGNIIDFRGERISIKIDVREVEERNIGVNILKKLTDIEQLFKAIFNKK